MLVVQVSGKDFINEMSRYAHSFGEQELWAIFNYFANFEDPQDFSPEDIILDFSSVTFDEYRKTDGMESASVGDMIDDISRVTRIVGVTNRSIVFYSF